MTTLRKLLLLAVILGAIVGTAADSIYAGGMTAAFIILLMKFTILLIAVCALYFTPSLVARKRHHRNMAPIVALNFFAGWTFFGWVGALVWALSDNCKEPVAKAVAAALPA